MGIDENQTIRPRKARQLGAALNQFLRSLADGRTIFRDALVQRHRGAAAAPSPQDDLGDAGLLLEKLHRLR
jgi:hypothetical protein